MILNLFNKDKKLIESAILFEKIFYPEIYRLIFVFLERNFESNEVIEIHTISIDIRHRNVL